MEGQEKGDERADFADLKSAAQCRNKYPGANVKPVSSTSCNRRHAHEHILREHRAHKTEEGVACLHALRRS